MKRKIHSRVVRHAARGLTQKQVREVLATVFRDDSGVRSMMEARETDFLHALDRLEGRVEWGVKVFTEPPPEPVVISRDGAGCAVEDK